MSGEVRAGSMRGWVAATLVTFLIFALHVPAQAGIADQVGATFGLMLQDVVSAFPPVEGVVVQVAGDHLYMDLSKKQGLLLGQEFLVFRGAGSRSRSPRPPISPRTRRT